MKRSVLFLPFGILVFMFLSQTSMLGGRPSINPSVAQAQEGWKAEYDSVCSKTDIAMTLPKEELSALIDRCDKLLPKIELEEESTRKVYLRRLQLCRELYRYVLEAKESR